MSAYAIRFRTNINDTQGFILENGSEELCMSINSSSKNVYMGNDLIVNRYGHFGDSQDLNYKGMVQITRPSTQPDSKHYISLVCQGEHTPGIGFKPGSDIIRL